MSVLLIEDSADLMKICIETAKQKFGDSFENEAIVRDLALSLYQEAIRKFDPVVNGTTLRREEDMNRGRRSIAFEIKR